MIYFCPDKSSQCAQIDAFLAKYKKAQRIEAFAASKEKIRTRIQWLDNNYDNVYEYFMKSG